MPDSVDSVSEEGYASWDEEPLSQAEMLQKIESVDHEITANADNPVVGAKVKDIGERIACRAYWYESKVIEEYLRTAERVGNVGEDLRKELNEIRDKLLGFKIQFPDEQGDQRSKIN